MAARRYPAIPRGSIADDIQAITEILDIGLGIRGDPLDRFLTWQDLLDKGIAKVIPDKVRRNGITDDAIGDGNPPTEGPSTSEPDAPTGFTATGGIDSVILVWDNPREIYDNHAYTEVWRHTSDDIGNAVLIGTSSGMSYIDHVGAIDETRYYWIRFMSKADVPGPFNSASGTSATTAGVVTGILDEAAVITSKLADASVDTNKLINLAVDAAKLADSAVTSTKIANLAVGNAAIANLAVGTAKIADLAVVNAKIADATITGAKIANATITGSLIASSTIVAANIVDSTITGAKISNATITDAHISNLSADKINAGTLTGRTIRTAASGKRVEIQGSTNDIQFYDASGNSLAWVGEASITTIFGTRQTSAYFGAGAQRELGVIGQGTVAGMFAITTTGLVGVSGWCGSTLGVGVEGIGGSSGTGVKGYSSIGVRGDGFSGGVGVWGQLPGGTGTTVYAVNGNIGVGSAGANTAFYGWDGDGYLVSGAWLPFTGAHQGLFLKSSAVDEGDIIVDTEIIGDSSITDCIAINSISSASNQAAVGVFRRRGPLPTGVAEEGDNSRPLAKPSPLQSIPELEYEALLEDYDLIEINAVGEGLINVCDYNGDISIGDLIVTCPVPGKGAKQADDIVRSYTVARARQAVTWASEPGTTKLIPCIYLSG